MEFRYDIPYASDIKMSKEDIDSLNELCDHVDKLLKLMEQYKEGTKEFEEIKESFQKIFDDSHSKNKLERFLAQYIINELKNLNLNMSWNHEKQTGFSFLDHWIEGKIADKKTIAKGCKGLCSKAGRVVIRSCKPDLILQQYKQ